MFQFSMSEKERWSESVVSVSISLVRFPSHKSSDRTEKQQFPKGSFVFPVIRVRDHKHLYKYISFQTFNSNKELKSEQLFLIIMSAY